MTSLEPIFFGESSRPLAGCIHRPTGSTLQHPPTLGVVICNPFGYEAICAHRSLKALANAAASRGIPTLRFDYDGTGDSFGDDFDANRLSAWIDSVKQAVEVLKAKSGVTQIVLVGVRLGATLATLAAAGRTDVVGLVAVATIVNGKSYLRELRALQMALDLAAAPSTAPPLPQGIQESVGFAISAETKTQLIAVDLLAQATAPAPHVLVLDRDDLAPNQAWVERLRAQGVLAEHQPLPGYVDMVLDPHKAQIPERMWGVAIGWIQERAAALAPTGAHSVGDASQAKAEALVPPPRSASIPFAASTMALLPTRETLEFIDADGLLFGVMSEPASEERAAFKHGRLGILLLNAGAIHHVGPNRLYVTLARKWAAAGHIVLRLDISGIGDSRTRPGETDNVVYSSRAGEDIAVAVRHLRAQPGVDRVLVMGLCSGAYHGFKAAVAGEAISALVPINPLTFFWKEGMSLDYPAHKVASESQRYGQSAMKLESWMKLLRGDVKVRVVAEVMSRRLLSLAERRARDVARRLGHPMADDLGAELEAVVNRGIAVDFVFADCDPGMDLLRLQGGSVVPRLKQADRLRSYVIDGPDHTFTPVWSHAPLVDQLTSIVKRHSHA